MRPKRNFSFGSLKNVSPSNYINYENISSQCPLLQNIIEHNDIKLSDIPKLQLETERIMSTLGYRMMNLKSLLDGKPIKLENGVLKDAHKSSKYLQFRTPPNELDTNSLENNTVKKNEELIVKTDPDKPLTLIISQNGPSTRRASKGLGTKRQLSLTVLDSETKRHKSFAINDKIEKDLKPNYEIPNKFWELMEPYCAEINEEHVKTLENYIQSYENDVKYYEVPHVDNNNDILYENKSLKIPSSRRHSNHTVEESNLNGFADNKSSVELSNLLKKIDSEIRKPLSQTRALKTFPQTLIGKISQESDEQISFHRTQVNDLNNDLSSEATCASKTLARQFKVSNSYKLERHVKKSMDDLGMCNFNLPFVPKLEPQFDLCNDSEAQGIAKSNEADIIDPIVLSNSDYVTLHLPNSQNCKRNGSLVDNVKEDKALLGLRRRQAELKLVSESNLGMLRRLLVAAKRDIKRQDIERRLAVADADVIDSYNVIESYRPTHKPPLKKDRDAAYKAIKDRQKVLKELEAFDSEFL